jgi:putative addiction module antidote
MGTGLQLPSYQMGATIARIYSVSTKNEVSMVRKIFRAGNSMVIALPKDMLDSLHLGEGGEVAVEYDAERRQIVIAPTVPRAEGVDEEFARQVAEFIDAYRPALEALAR